MLHSPREVPSRPRRPRGRTLRTGRERDGCTGNGGPLDGRFRHGAVRVVPLPVRPPRNGEARHPRHAARPPPLFRPPFERPPPALVGRDIGHDRRVVCPVARRTPRPPQVRGWHPFRGKSPACHLHPVGRSTWTRASWSIRSATGYPRWSSRVSTRNASVQCSTDWRQPGRPSAFKCFRRDSMRHFARRAPCR